MAVVKPVASVTKPKPPKGPKTPPGYIGQAGSPPPPTRPTGSRPGGTRVPTPDRLPPAASITPPPPPPPPPPAPTFQPTSAWWMEQLAADPRYAPSAAALELSRQNIGRSYGVSIVRDAQGRPTYRTAAGDTGITQQLNDKGEIVYRDQSGKEYPVGMLSIHFEAVRSGQPGYLTGQYGAAEAGSQARQYRIGEESAQAGLRRSGMRASTQAQEFAALQSALAGLTGRAGAELAGVDEKYAELYREIYGDLAKKADELAAPVTPPETPAPPVETGPQTAPASTGPTTVAGVTVPQAPLPKPKTIEIAGQNVEFPKGINLAGVDVDAIGRRIVGNIRAAGGVGKLRNGQRVGEFRAGDKGYRVFYRGGRFVIELIG